MTPLTKAKQLDCKSIIRVAHVSGVPLRTLQGWFTSRPFVFEAVYEKVVRERYQSQADGVWPNLNIKVK